MSEKEFLNEGMESFKKGDLDRAEEIFKDFLKNYPNGDLADNACYNLAQISMKRGQKQRALEWLEYLLKNFPESDAAYFAKDEKIELMREMGIGPAETAEELFYQGKNALEIGNIDEAERIFLRFLKTYADSDFIDNAHYNLAAIYKTWGRMDQVRHHIDIIMNQYPDSDAAIYAKDLLND